MLWKKMSESMRLCFFISLLQYTADLVFGLLVHLMFRGLCCYIVDEYVSV